MDRVLILSTSTNNTDTVINSLKSLERYDVEVFRYDKNYHSICAQAIAQNPDYEQHYKAGNLSVPYDLANMDPQVLEMISDYNPDIVIYISAWTGDFRLSVETLSDINSKRPLIHMLFDQSDDPWWNQLKTFEEANAFSLTVGIDGGHYWPGGIDWDGLWEIKNAITLLTPLDPAPFRGTSMPFHDRPFPITYNGNANGWVRAAYLQQIQKRLDKVLFVRNRDDRCDSYKEYIEFMKHSRLTINIPFTGSNAKKHVKGRVLEAGFAGACLLEMKNDATESWFTPWHHYIDYTSVDELVDWAEFLMKHPRISAEIAVSMREELERNHCPLVFWDNVFASLPE